MVKRYGNPGENVRDYRTDDHAPGCASLVYTCGGADLFYDPFAAVPFDRQSDRRIYAPLFGWDVVIGFYNASVLACHLAFGAFGD